MWAASTRLSEVLKEPTCLVGVGNDWRGDDAVGLWLADGLVAAGLPPGLQVCRAEDVPENHVFEIARRDCRNVILADAVRAEAEPGSVVFGRLVDAGGVDDAWCTHRLSLGLCARLLEQMGKPTYLLGIAARNTDLGDPPDPALRRVADRLRDLILSSSGVSR